MVWAAPLNSTSRVWLPGKPGKYSSYHRLLQDAPHAGQSQDLDSYQQPWFRSTNRWHADRRSKKWECLALTLGRACWAANNQNKWCFCVMHMKSKLEFIPRLVKEIQYILCVHKFKQLWGQHRNAHINKNTTTDYSLFFLLTTGRQAAVRTGPRSLLLYTWQEGCRIHGWHFFKSYSM